MIERSLQDKTSRTCLMRAVMWGRTKTVQVLTEEINQRPRPEEVQINQADALGWTALHHAAAAGQLLSIRELAKNKGLKVNYTDIAGRTPLHSAAQHCHFQATELLVKMKADVNALDARGRTPLHLAAALHDRSLHSILAKPKPGQGKAKSVLLKRTPKEGLALPEVNFALPVKNGVSIVEVEKEYIRIRHKTDGIKPFLPTPQFKTCKILKKYGADTSIEDEEGHTALSLCASKEEDLLELLTPEEKQGE